MKEVLEDFTKTLSDCQETLRKARKLLMNENYGHYADRLLDILRDMEDLESDISYR